MIRKGQIQGVPKSEFVEQARFISRVFVLIVYAAAVQVFQ